MGAGCGLHLAGNCGCEALVRANENLSRVGGGSLRKLVQGGGVGVEVGVRRGEPGKKECGLGVGAAEVKRGLASSRQRAAWVLAPPPLQLQFVLLSPCLNFLL